jgi:hypothetical protein
VIPRTAFALPFLTFLVPCPASAADAVDIAASLIGRPYVWGAEGPRSFDCSGLTQYVYQEVGVELPRRAIGQSRVGEPAGRRLQRGDLVFFSTDTRRSEVTHVGIYEGDGMMIEASKRFGRVRRDSLSDPYWVERLMFARRVTSLLARGRNEPRDEPVGRPRPRSTDRRRVAVQVIERIAEALLRRPR